MAAVDTFGLKLASWLRTYGLLIAIVAGGAAWAAKAEFAIEHLEAHADVHEKLLDKLTTAVVNSEKADAEFKATVTQYIKGHEALHDRRD